MTAACPFTKASPSYIAAQRTNQARDVGYDFSERVMQQAPWFIRVLEVLFRPSSIVSLGLLAVCVWLVFQ